MATRTYVIGLPVLVTVNDDGDVSYDIDTAEAALEVSEYEFEDPDDPRYDFLTLDANNIDRDHEIRMAREQE